MTLYDVNVTVAYRDHNNKVRSLEYTLRQQFDTTANTGAGNMNDVLTAAQGFITAADVITMDHIDKYDVSIVVPQSGAPANISANNQVEGYSKVRRADGGLDFVRFPAWDTVLYTANEFGQLDVAYDAAVLVAIAFLKDDESESNLVSTVFNETRAIKSRGKQLR